MSRGKVDISPKGFLIILAVICGYLAAVVVIFWAFGWFERFESAENLPLVPIAVAAAVGGMLVQTLMRKYMKLKQ